MKNFDFRRVLGGGNREEARVAEGLTCFASKTVALSDWQIRPTALKRVAFTLAEVLITLGIIGVVAAITLPTLVANYQKQVWVNQLKKTYTTLNEGLKQMLVQENCTEVKSCLLFDYHGDNNGEYHYSSSFYELFPKVFNLVDYSTENNYYNSKYKREVKKIGGGSHSFNDIPSGYSFGYSTGLAGSTKNGEIYMLEYGPAGSSVTVDINGFKQPNQIGRDIFIFVLSPKSSSFVPIESSSFYSDYVYGNSSDESYMEQRIEEMCNTSSSSSIGETCAAKIIMDGWKMNY